MSQLQFVACKFRIGDTRLYTYHNDGPLVAEGDQVRVEDRSGQGWKRVFVVSIVGEPSYPTKPILGLHTEEAPADELFAAASPV